MDLHQVTTFVVIKAQAIKAGVISTVNQV